MVIKINVDFSEIIDFQKEVSESPKKYKEHIRDILSGMRDEFYTDVKSNTPVDTGYLKSQWKKGAMKEEHNIIKNSWSTSVSNDADYAGFVNYGHKIKNGGYFPGYYFVERSIYKITSQDVRKLHGEKYRGEK